MARGRKTGGGSRKGAPNKNNAKTREELWAYCTERSINPLTFLLDIVGDTTQPMDFRAQCAREIAPYMAAKLKQIEHRVDDETRTLIRVVLSGDTDH